MFSRTLFLLKYAETIERGYLLCARLWAAEQIVRWSTKQVGSLPWWGIQSSRAMIKTSDWVESVEHGGILGSEDIQCDTVMVEAGHCALVQTRRADNTERDP